MNKKRYNCKELIRSVDEVRTIFKYIGIELPQGDIKEVYDAIAANEYIDWKNCTLKEAKEAVNNGTIAIGIGEDKIVILSADDKELDTEFSNLQYYSYSNKIKRNNCYKDLCNEIVFTNLDVLHNMAKVFDKSNAMKLTLQFIRRKVYGSENWNIVAGEVNQNFVNYVMDNNCYIYNFFTTNSLTIYDYSGYQIDFLHLCATMNCIIFGGKTYWNYLSVGQTHVRNLSGWAGDLQAVVVDAYMETNATNNYNTFYNKVYQIMGNENYSFSMKDLLADIDGFNFAYNWLFDYWQSNLFGTACRYYYRNINILGTGWTSKSCLRFRQFIGSDTKFEFSNIVSLYTNQYWGWPIKWPIYEYQAKNRGITIDLTNNQSDAARDAFVDFIWQKYQAE